MLNMSFLVLEESKCPLCTLHITVFNNLHTTSWLETLKYLEFLRIREIHIRKSYNYRSFTVSFANYVVTFSKLS